MRKFFKIAIAVVLLLAIAGGGALYYFTKVKTYDVADEDVDKIVEDPYSISFPEGTPLPENVQKDDEGLVIVDEQGDFVLSDGSTMTTDEWFSSPDYQQAVTAAGSSGGTGGAGTGSASGGSDDTAAGGSSGSSGSGDTASSGGSTSGGTGTTDSTGSTGGSTDGNTGGSSGSGSGGGTDSTGGRTTAADIKSRYSGSFDSLQGQAQTQLNSLIGQAKSEYDAKKASGETINPAYFYQKYSGAASSVEAKTDSAFNSLYNSMTSELKANGLSTTAADEYKAQYEATKEGMRSELMSKVTGG